MKLCDNFHICFSLSLFAYVLHIYKVILYLEIAFFSQIIKQNVTRLKTVYKPYTIRTRTDKI